LLEAIKISSSINNALAKLINASNLVARGHFNVKKIEMKSEDEFQTLANAFNDMISKITENFSEIGKQKRLFETMFNTIPDGVVITNTKRVIQLANKGMNSTFGYKPEELLGKSTKMLYADWNRYKNAEEVIFIENSEENGELYGDLSEKTYLRVNA